MFLAKVPLVLLVEKRQTSYDSLIVVRLLLLLLVNQDFLLR